MSEKRGTQNWESICGMIVYLSVFSESLSLSASLFISHTHTRFTHTRTHTHSFFISLTLFLPFHPTRFCCSFPTRWVVVVVVAVDDPRVLGLLQFHLRSDVCEVVKSAGHDVPLRHHQHRHQYFRRLSRGFRQLLKKQNVQYFSDNNHLISLIKIVMSNVDENFLEDVITNMSIKKKGLILILDPFLKIPFPSRLDLVSVSFRSETFSFRITRPFRIQRICRIGNPLIRQAMVTSSPTLTRTRSGTISMVNGAKWGKIFFF